MKRECHEAFKANMKRRQQRTHEQARYALEVEQYNEGIRRGYERGFSDGLCPIPEFRTGPLQIMKGRPS